MKTLCSYCKDAESVFFKLGNTGERLSLNRGTLEQFVFWSLSLILLIFIGVIDRSNLFDNDNYLHIFQETDWSWFVDLFKMSDTYFGVFASIISEEVVWRLWTLLLGHVFTPEQSVRFTVLLLNLLVVIALSRSFRPLLSLALWILLPMTFAVIGLYQLRQGFAFALMLYITIVHKRPFLGCLVAAFFHTTFVIPLLFAFVAEIFGIRICLALAATVVIAFILVKTGSYLFSEYGGRRTLEYDVNEGGASINFVFGSLILALPSLMYLIRYKNQDSSVSKLAIVHLGCIAFCVLSFFIFPLGTSRVDYYTVLFLIVVIPAFRVRTIADKSVLLVVSLFLGYVIFRGYQQGQYSELFSYF